VIPVASIDFIGTRAGVQDLQNAPSLLFKGGLPLSRSTWFPWRVQGLDTMAVECLYPVPDTWIRRESDTILRKMAENGSFIAKALAAVD
jgi:hypothetical protein